MTETEARQLIKRIEYLCAEYERDCKCKIFLNIREKREGVKKISFIEIENISIKID